MLELYDRLPRNYSPSLIVVFAHFHIIAVNLRDDSGTLHCKLVTSANLISRKVASLPRPHR